MNSETLSETDLRIVPIVNKVKFLNTKARTSILSFLMVIVVGFNSVSFYVSIKNIIK